MEPDSPTRASTLISDQEGAFAPGPPSRRRLMAGVVLIGLAMGCLWWLSPRLDSQTLVVYCAHDAEFAAPILQRFENETGIRVALRYDTEANKSLGLVNRLLAERESPECDVFWNNELLGTLELARQDVLEPYIGSGHRRIPDQFKDPAGRWTGFAARLRMYILNPEAVPPEEGAITGRLESEDLSRVALAKPLFGTTLTQYCVWWAAWGGEALQQRHREWQRRGIRIADGNAATRNLVAGGACDLGFTDTDDYFGARDAGRPVDGLPVRVQGRTICIPNSVAILRGTPRREAARLLVDYLLSAETELALARSPSRQIPLGPVDETQVPEEVAPLRLWAGDGTDLRPLIDVRDDVLAWLRAEYAP